MSDKNPWVLEKVVLPQHTDHAGVMWHGAYLQWLEEGRIKALSQVGLEYANLSTKGFEIPVVSLNIKYSKPLLHGDNATLKSWVYQCKGLRFNWKTIFFNDINQEVAKAEISLVVVKKTDEGLSKVMRCPPKYILDAISTLGLGPNS